MQATYEAARSSVDVALSAAAAGARRRAGRLRAVPPARPPRHARYVRRLLLLQQRRDRGPPPRVHDGVEGDRARRRLPPRQRHPADLLRARRRAVRLAARRPGPRLSVRDRSADETGAGRGSGTPQLPAAGRDGRRRLPRRARRGLRGRSSRSGRRCSSCRSASTRSTSTRSATSRSPTDGFESCGAVVARLGLPTVVLQEGGYDVDDLGENVRRWLLGAAAAAD